jgi:hypothetical protein
MKMVCILNKHVGTDFNGRSMSTDEIRLFRLKFLKELFRWLKTSPDSDLTNVFPLVSDSEFENMKDTFSDF